ncbi:MAG: sugar phosphorylase [Pseudomonadota bacterium]
MSTPPSALAELEQRVALHLRAIYPDADAAALTRRLIDTLELDTVALPRPHENKWSQADVLVITYGNTIVRGEQPPLQTLREFLDRRLADSISGVHVLPFFPYSSDDGFAVINYLQVNGALGDWDDVSAIAKRFDLMADLVINHASSRSQWFENFKAGVDPGHDYFVAVPPDTDVADVVRPRSSPLLQPVQTRQGERHVWCTFGPDQVDLNFANPDVLVEFTNILARYLEAGVRILRLDAVAFLWKVPGTPCVHLQPTHEIVKLLRLLAEVKRADALVITETNVPLRDNLTYFGNANEAHTIYNFSLPPLLIHALVSGNCRHLKTWMMRMPPACAGTCYLNFIASHDGVGLRPAEGLLDDGELEALLDTLERFGGYISMRSDAGGTLRPYEANISLWSALAGTIDGGEDDLQFERFVCAHAIMLALEGIPAIYLNSLFGTPNDTVAVERSGRYRSINRHLWDADDLDAELDDANHRTSRVFAGLTRLLDIRRRQPAFHPNAVQFTMHLGLEIFAFWRQSVDRRQSIFCLSNVTAQPQRVELTQVNLIDTESWVDLVTGEALENLRGRLELAPYQTVWLSNRDGAAAAGASSLP